MSEIPIYIDGKREGVLTIEDRGSYAELDARLRDVGRVVRLSVYGEREAYLGVPVPEDGELRLTRRLGSKQLGAFPRRPEYAAETRLSRRAEEDAPEEPPGEDSPREARHVLWFGGRPHYF